VGTSDRLVAVGMICRTGSAGLTRAG
jgi:hypothetical protein